MNCPSCGAGATQSPDGRWYCNNQCGWSSGVAPAPTASAPPSSVPDSVQSGTLGTWLTT